ncbi:MAG: hypothetical protein ACO3D0_09310, partial [Ilumatobacteraceae bacterium]
VARISAEHRDAAHEWLREHGFGGIVKHAVSATFGKDEDAAAAKAREMLEAELADLRARAEADIAAAGGRANDELRAEISRLAAAATDRVIADGALDDATQQALIETFIARVGASS